MASSEEVQTLLKRMASTITVVNMVTVMIAQVVAGRAAVWLMSLTDQDELLLILVGMVYVLTVVVFMGIQQWFRWNDGKITPFESLFVQTGDAFKWLIFLMSTNVMVQLMQEKFEVWTLPRWYEIVNASLVILMVVLTWAQRMLNELVLVNSDSGGKKRVS